MEYIDNFTIILILFSQLLFLIFVLVYVMSSAFSWFLNNIFDLKKQNNNISKNYDNFFQD